MSATGTWVIDSMNLSEEIKWCLEEYFKLKELYKKPRLIILPNPQNTTYIAQIKDDIIGDEDSGVYEVITFIQMGENGLEFNQERIEKVASKITSKNFDILHRRGVR
jgi:hypothetical protein